MNYLLKLVAVAALALSSPLAAALPDDKGYGYGYPTHKSCPGTTITTIRVTTVLTTVTTHQVLTLPTTVTLPYSCYTQIIPTSNQAPSCGTLTGFCQPPPTCVVTSTSTQPCRDPCCPTTSTIYTPAACATCRTDCSTKTKYVQQTKGCTTRH